MFLQFGYQVSWPELWVLWKKTGRRLANYAPGTCSREGVMDLRTDVYTFKQRCIVASRKEKYKTMHKTIVTTWENTPASYPRFRCTPGRGRRLSWVKPQRQGSSWPLESLESRWRPTSLSMFPRPPATAGTTFYQGRFGGLFQPPSVVRSQMIVAGDSMLQMCFFAFHYIHTYMYTYIHCRYHAFLFGDHGGVMLAVKRFTPTKEAQYSVNGGETWWVCIELNCRSNEDSTYFVQKNWF